MRRLVVALAAAAVAAVIAAVPSLHRVRASHAVAAPAASAAATATATAPPRSDLVVLDPGHGSHTGAESPFGVWEDDNVLAIAQQAARLLAARGVPVRLTRTGPAILAPGDADLTTRVAEATAWGAALFISIHQNWSTDPAAHGLETFYATPDSAALARAVQRALVAATGLADLGLGHRVFWVVACNPMPAVLVEGGFLSQPDEAPLISGQAFQEREAAALADAVSGYLADASAPRGARPLPARLQAMCALGPSAAKTWVQETWAAQHR
jgi:N-acetylmuramoyl-L-alanine amidase